MMQLTWDGDRAAFAKAFVAAQMAAEAVTKANMNPAFKSKYADLAAVVEAVIPALNAQGIGVMQFPAFDGEFVTVTTTFLHDSGASVSSDLRLRPSKSDPQGVGSAVTYGRRYSLLAMMGAAPEDDDGNAASGPHERPQPDRRGQHGNTAVVIAAKTGIGLCNSPEQLKTWHTEHSHVFEQVNPVELDEIRNAYAARMKALKAATPEEVFA
jgi:hypothetical protein